MKSTLILAGAMAVLLWNCSKLQSDHAANATAKCQLCHEVPPQNAFHAAHVGQRGYDCSLCHPDCARNAEGVPQISGPLHANGDTDVVFSTSLFPLGQATYNHGNKTCSSVYCHGFLSGGDSAVMHLTDTLSVARCEACHNIALMAARGHLPHASDMITNPDSLSLLVLACGNCHIGYSYINRQVNAATHINGSVEPVGNDRCQACHNNPVPHTDGRTDCITCHVK
jgi:hypothetical protein